MSTPAQTPTEAAARAERAVEASVGRRWHQLRRDVGFWIGGVIVAVFL